MLHHAVEGERWRGSGGEVEKFHKVDVYVSCKIVGVPHNELVYACMHTTIIIYSWLSHR